MDDEDDREREYEDEVADKRGTSECDGLCIPMCSWCLVGHICPDECAGGPCPYESIEKARTGP